MRQGDREDGEGGERGEGEVTLNMILIINNN